MKFSFLLFALSSLFGLSSWAKGLEDLSSASRKADAEMVHLTAKVPSNRKFRLPIRQPNGVLEVKGGLITSNKGKSGVIEVLTHHEVLQSVRDSIVIPPLKWTPKTASIKQSNLANDGKGAFGISRKGTKNKLEISIDQQVSKVPVGDSEYRVTGATEIKQGNITLKFELDPRENALNISKSGFFQGGLTTLFGKLIHPDPQDKILHYEVEDKKLTVYSLEKDTGRFLQTDYLLSMESAPISATICGPPRRVSARKAETLGLIVKSSEVSEGLAIKVAKSGKALRKVRLKFSSNDAVSIPKTARRLASPSQ